MHSQVKTVASLASLYAFRMLGLFMVLPVLMLYGGEYRGASPALLGLALGVYGLTQALFQIPLGLLSDIWGRKPVIFLGLVIFAIGSLVAALASSIEGLILGRALQGSGAIASAIMAMVADLTSEENRTKAMAAIGASIGLSFSVAMIVGPGIASSVGLGGVFGVSALLALIGLLVLLFVVPSPPRLSASHRDTGAIPALILASLKDTQLLRLNWGIFVLHFVLMAAFLVVPLMLEERFAVSRDSHWLVYLGLLGIAFVLMLPLVMFAERKRRVKTVFVGAVALLGFSLAVLSQVNASIVVWLTLLLLFFTAFNLLEASLPSLVSKIAPAGAKGTAMGIYSTSQFLGAFAGGVSGGWLLEYYGPSEVYLLGAVVVAVWFAFAVTMKSPRYLSSVSVSVAQNFNATACVLAVPGVEDVLFVSEDALLYLKVDKRVFDESELNRVLQRNS
ncbi:MFS transporter [Teredinibacter purpureus]|uniref:MFS transporter n=1 Tax=Teredinibacter purpureus TaxID=2731756 RepID=UPI000696F19F|nr:MFS transporter [Teredinibacter purpureus]